MRMLGNILQGTKTLSRGLRTASVATLFVLLALAEAHAGICESLNAQLRDASRSSNPEVAALNRQLAAIRALEGQRNCAASNRTGIFSFFSACGDLKRRKNGISRRIEQASAYGGGNRLAIRSQMDSMGCAVASAKPREYSWGSGNTMLFCVRQSDGYLFPAPNSQFVGADDYKLTLSRCQYICDDPNMDVYVRNSGSAETEEMISISQRKPYGEMANAFKYRESADFKTCNSQRYHQRVAEQRSRETTPTNIDDKGLVLPRPEARPQIDSIMAYSGEPPAKAETPFDRKVRVVGSPFLPEQ